MKNNPVCWFEIYVQDLARAKSFYEGVFQIKLAELKSPEPSLEMLAFPMEMTTYGAGGALVKMAGFPAGGNNTVIYFSCDDCGVEERRVRDFGGTIHKRKMAIGEYGFVSLVMDSEGNMIGLHSLQ